MNLRHALAIPVIFWLAACSGDDAPTEEGAPDDSDAGDYGQTTDEIPPAPENGLQIVTSDFDLRPGEDMQSCYYTTLSNDEDVFVRSFDAFQGEGGHHVILMSPLQPQPDGTVEDCTSGDSMLKYMPLLTTMELNHLVLEEGLAIRIPAHAQVVVQSHYINTETVPVSVRDTVNLGFVDAGTEEDVTTISSWGTSYLSLAIPPSEPSSLTYRCTADRDIQLLSLIGHMHNEGSHMSIDIGPPGALERIYTVDTWEPSFRDMPPSELWTKDAPFVLHAGDQMEVTCNWASTASDVIGFPVEMCASNAWFFPADSSLTCVGDLVGGNAAAAP